MLTTQEIEQKASELFASLPSELQNIFPVPLVKVAHSLGYTTYFFEDSNSGLAGKVNHDTKQIFINPADHKASQTFTLAHEIGHIVLHRDSHPEHHMQEDENINVYSDKIEEIEANRFASALLMPSFEFKRKWSDFYRDINEIAFYFNVSTLVASIRANNLNLLDI